MARLIPDLEAAFRKFPVAVFLLLGGVLVMLTAEWSGDTGLLGEVRPDGQPTPPARFALLLMMTGIFWTVAIEFLGAACGWPAWMRQLGGLAAFAVAAALATLPDTLPVLAARWLPFDLWRQVFAAGMLAVAASACGLTGHAANLRILRTVTIVIGTPFLMWFLMLGFTWVSVQFFPAHANWFGYYQSGLPPLHQTVVVAMATLAALGWLASPAASPQLASPQVPSRAYTAAAAFMRNFVFPVVILLALLFCLQQASSVVRWVLAGDYVRSSWNLEPLAVLLMLVIGVFLVAAELPDRDKGLTAYALAIWPGVATAMAAITVFGLAIDVPTWLRQFSIWERVNWSVADGLWMQAFPLVALLLVWLWPKPRDLRLVVVPWALAALISGFGPWMPGHMHARQIADDFQRKLTQAGYVEDGRLRQESREPWTEEIAAETQASLRWLSHYGALGLLAPMFQGVADDPFAGWPNQVTISLNLQRQLEEIAKPAQAPVPPSPVPATPQSPSPPPSAATEGPEVPPVSDRIITGPSRF